MAAVATVSAACGTSSQRTEPLRTYEGDDAGTVHVASLNSQRGPGKKTVTFPENAVGFIVRFDCVGDDREMVDLQVTDLGLEKGGLSCISMADQEYSAGYTNIGDERAVRKGSSTTVAVNVAEDVRWSLSIDLVDDQETYDRLSGRSSK